MHPPQETSSYLCMKARQDLGKGFSCLFVVVVVIVVLVVEQGSME